jgi:hypothetical protein
MRLKGRVAWLLVWSVLCIGVARVDANGDIQRELQARVVAVDHQAGTFEIERQFRGQTWRFTLKFTPTTRLYSCGEKVPTLTELQAGDLVSVYYQPIGREGIVTLVVIEPKE